MSELLLCIPGSWADRADFLRRVITLEPNGRYMYAGGLLADVHAKDHVEVELHDADPQIARAFEIASRGAISDEILARARAHTGVAYVQFPIAISEQRERVLKFGALLEQAGGIAVKVESSGIAHSWQRWSKLLGGSPFDLYVACVVLVADEQQYYSCGMHHFGLPECAVQRTLPPNEAADLMNRFNYWRIVERPTLADGHTFSVSGDAPRFRMTLERDGRHAEDDPFHNEHGVWSLRGVPRGV